MKTKNLKIIITLSALLILFGGFFSSYVEHFDYAQGMERTIPAAYEKDQNILSQYSNKITEMAQIPKMYAKDFKDVYSSTMVSRYGENGSGAAMQWIKEQNPQLDPSLYKKIQITMEAGRNKFENAQNLLIDLKRSYDTRLNTFWGRFMFGLTGHPSNGFNLDDYKIIKSSYAKDAFDKGVEDGIKL